MIFSRLGNQTKPLCHVCGWPDHLWWCGYSQLEKLADLEDNWNGYGAKPIDHLVIHKAEKLLEKIHPIFKVLKVFPTARNSIQFDFRDAKDRIIEIEIFSNRYNFWREKDIDLNCVNEDGIIRILARDD